MKQYFDAELLGDEMKTKRVIQLKTGLREVSKKIKVSTATLSRMENGNKADIDNVIAVCNWLGKSLCDFIKLDKKVKTHSKEEPEPKFKRWDDRDNSQITN